MVPSLVVVDSDVVVLVSAEGDDVGDDDGVRDGDGAREFVGVREVLEVDDLVEVAGSTVRQSRCLRANHAGAPLAIASSGQVIRYIDTSSTERHRPFLKATQ